MQTVLGRKRANTALNKAALREQNTEQQLLPNSAVLSLVGKNGTPDSSNGLKEKLTQRFASVEPHIQEQIPSAENEADRLSASVTSGSPEAVKSAMGQKLGADFSAVRFHTGRDAAARADAMGARAFTSGADVYFGEGGFDASVAAHELVHTAQQGMVDSNIPTMSTPVGGVQMKPKDKPSRKERLGESFGEASLRRFKNIGHIISGTGRHLAGGIADGGHLAKDFVVGKAHSIRRKHQRAVDQLNNNRQDYKDMSLWERFKWTAKNPLARISASSKELDTAKRNIRNEQYDMKVRELAAKNNYDLGDAAYDPRADEYYNSVPAQENAAEAGDVSGVENGSAALEAMAEQAAPQEELNDYGETIPGKQEVFDHIAGEIVRDKLLGIGHKGGLIAGKGISAPAASAREISEAAETGNDIDLDGVDMAFGGLGGMVGGGASFARAGANVMRTIDAAKTGNVFDATRSGTTALLDSTSGIANVAKGISYLAGSSDAAGLIGGSIVPGVNVVAGGWRALSGAMSTGRSLNTRDKMKDRMKGLEQARDEGRLTRDGERYYRTLNQAKRMASVRAVEGGFDVASGLMKAGGGIATLAGAGAPVGASLAGASVATNIVKGLVTDHMKKNRRADVVEEELHLEEKIKELQQQGYSQKEAKNIVLKSMGFGSGTRKEAFQHITMKRATELHKRANDGDEDTRQLLRELGLHRVGGKYSLQGISEKLGMDTGLSWQTQMDKVAHSRDMNMFRYKAEENRENIRKEKEKQRAAEQQEIQKKLAKEAVKKSKKLKKTSAV